MAAINAQGIPCFSGSCSEIYLEKAFPAEMRPNQRLEVARELGETSLLFLVHPTLSETDMIDTYNAVKGVFQVAANGTNGKFRGSPQMTMKGVYLPQKP